MLYILSALPNSLIIPTAGEAVEIKGITLQEVRETLSTSEFVSGVGHATTADLYSAVLGLPVTFNRLNVEKKEGNTIIAGIFTPPRRLAEGEKWSEEDILKMQINWVIINL